MIQQKVALVTGANRGIGLAVVKQLLQKGYTTILTSRKPADGEKAVSGLPEYRANLHYHSLDITDQNSVDTIKQYVIENFGRLDILINNAGINYDSWQKTIEADLQVVEDTLQTNLIGAWRMAQAFIPAMKKHHFGRIVNVSSGAGALAGMGGGTPAYSVSKAALNALTIKLGVELKGTGILVNAVCPGWVRTGMGGKMAPRSAQKGAETIIWCAELPEDGPTAKFFRDKKEIDF